MADLSIEQAFGPFITGGGLRGHTHQPMKRGGHVSQDCHHCQDIRNAMLAVLEGYIAAVNFAAERDVLRGKPLEGAHHRAMEYVADSDRRRIEALGKEEQDE